MPLSEHEERVLRQIERQLGHERGLASTFRVPLDPQQAARNAKWAAAGFVAGLCLLVASLAFSWVAGLAGFLLMLAASFVLAQCLRRLAQQRWGRAEGGGAGGNDGGPQGGRRHRWWTGRGE